MVLKIAENLKKWMKILQKNSLTKGRGKNTVFPRGELKQFFLIFFF